MRRGFPAGPTGRRTRLRWLHRCREALTLGPAPGRAARAAGVRINSARLARPFASGPRPAPGARGARRGPGRPRSGACRIVGCGRSRTKGPRSYPAPGARGVRCGRSRDRTAARRIVGWDRPSRRLRRTNGVGSPRPGHPAPLARPAPTGEARRPAHRAGFVTDRYVTAWPVTVRSLVAPAPLLALARSASAPASRLASSNPLSAPSLRFRRPAPGQRRAAPRSTLRRPPCRAVVPGPRCPSFAPAPTGEIARWPVAMPGARYSPAAPSRPPTARCARLCR